MRFIFFAIMAGFLIVSDLQVYAHAFLDHANPLVGSSVRSSPRDVTLWFTQNLESAFSTITVTDTSGQRVDAGAARISGSTMRVGLRPLRPGSYRVNWRVLSVDTHTTEGNFTFRVGE
jgi:copper resistance protein C